MGDVTQMSATAIAARIRGGGLRAEDVVEAHLERIDAVDEHVAAYVTVLADRARRAARDRDAGVRAGRLRGPLHGVPVAIKDLIAIEGVPMTAGSSFLGRQPERQSATVVRRLEDAGVVVLGTTATGADGTFEFEPVEPPISLPFTAKLVAGSAMCESPFG